MKSVPAEPRLSFLSTHDERSIFKIQIGRYEHTYYQLSITVSSQWHGTHVLDEWNAEQEQERTVILTQTQGHTIPYPEQE